MLPIIASAASGFEHVKQGNLFFFVGDIDA